MTGWLDHGVVGNGRVLALIAPSSAIEWLCLPRFDSPSVFGRLLDARHGGTMVIRSPEGELEGRASYLRGTNVLRTELTQGESRFEVIDFAPRVPRGLSVQTPLELVRIIQPITGSPRLVVEYDPRPDYGRAPVHQSEGAVALELRAGGIELSLFSDLPVSFISNRQPFVLRRPIYLLLSAGGRREAPRASEVHQLYEDTVAGWREWAKSCALPSFCPDAVLRSALCLKLHAFSDTGAIIAAATTSIPEAMGTERTWDYRYCWLRDAAFVVEAFRRISHLAEGEQFVAFLRDVAEAGPLQPVYGVGGERELEEIMLPHLAGFHGNGLVRIGNAASLQRQHDLNGELVLCLETVLSDPRIAPEDATTYLPLVERLVEEAIELAPQPDTGIWEFRTLLRHHTFSRAMCWAGIERGARLARRLGRPDLAARWGAIADQERDLVLARGYNESAGLFAQVLDGQLPDASSLLLPTLGLLDARDPRFLATLEAYERRLVRGGFMLRYANDDDFGETTSAFTLCSFWWAEALALAGQLERAQAVFQHVLRHANPLGLFSEDIEPRTGRLLGNFPQAYTHVGLIHAAVTIGDHRDARDGHVRAWSTAP